MKKVFLTTCLALVMLVGCVYPRQTNSVAAGSLNPPSKKKNFRNDIEMRAVRDLLSRYPNVDDAAWHKSDKHFIAVFVKDSIQTRVVYNNVGKLEYIMKYYEEAKMRKDIRHIVKSTYYDYTIYVIQEIEKPDEKPVYIVNLKGATDWKKVRVYDGEMEVLESFKRGK